MHETKIAKKFLFTAIAGIVIYGSAHAQGHVGGGDECKNLINMNRIAIHTWIQRDEASDLDFSNTPGWTYFGRDGTRSYKSKMLDTLREGKVIVSCYLDPALIHDPDTRELAEKESLTYKSVSLGGTPVTCVNYEDQIGTSHIDCNYELILKENKLNRSIFKTIHHEFDSIAGVEARNEWPRPSDYSISNQLSDFEKIVQTIVLGPRKKNVLPMSQSGNDCSIEIWIGHQLFPKSFLRGWYQEEKRAIEKRGYRVTDHKQKAAFKLLWDRPPPYETTDPVYSLLHKASGILLTVANLPGIPSVADPRAVQLQLKYDASNSITERTIIGDELKHGAFFPTEGISARDQTESQLPTCDEFYFQHP